MAIRSIYKYARMSPKKAVEVARVIRGKPAEEALNLLRFIPKKAARLFYKTLHSAIANAENNHGLNASTLFVCDAAAETGPVFRRYNPGPRGQAMPIRKRTTHLKVVLDQKL